jgi:hypothetical protein
MKVPNAKSINRGMTKRTMIMKTKTIVVAISHAPFYKIAHSQHTKVNTFNKSGKSRIFQMERITHKREIEWTLKPKGLELVGNHVG